MQSPGQAAPNKRRRHCNPKISTATNSGARDPNLSNDSINTCTARRIMQVLLRAACLLAVATGLVPSPAPQQRLAPVSLFGGGKKEGDGALSNVR